MKKNKSIFLIICFSILTLTTIQLASADYSITNDSTTETAWVIYSVWRPASGDWPAGWRTQGWRRIEPSGTENLSVPAGNTWVYIRVERPYRTEIKPPDHATRDSAPFWIHPSRAFRVVETNEGEFLKSNHVKWSLETADLYKYRNGDSHTIVEEPRLPDLPAHQIYNQAINSVIWIHTGDSTGSGVLIDKERRLVVTNAHVTDHAESVGVVFPYRQNGKLIKDRDFYFEDNNFQWFYKNGYITEARVIAQNVKNDLAIIQLNGLPPTASEIKHDFSRNVEDSMRQSDRVHILGNPGERLWNWTKGDFVESKDRNCLLSGGACLVLESDIHGGNSGGPVLNGQGMLVGIITETDNETLGFAAPARNVKALLDTLRPRHTFKIRNYTGVTVSYQIRWTYNQSWKNHALRTGFVKTHLWNVENPPQGYPKIRFDHVADDGQQVTYRTHKLDTALSFQGNNDHAPTYRFQYNRSGNRLYLFRDAAAAPALPTTEPQETTLLPNYPNPFNPETWIPYQLAIPTEVILTIYTADRRLIRTLALGHQPAGIYHSKIRAAYWDGRNEMGEPVASGVYFYTLTADDFTATRKMLILK